MPWAGGGGQTDFAIDPDDGDVVFMASDNGGLFKTSNGGVDWFAGNGNIGYQQFNSLGMDPLDKRVIYAMASDNKSGLDMGALLRTRDRGGNWEVVYTQGPADDAWVFTNWPSCRSIALPYDPSDPARYDADGDGLTDTIYVGAWGNNDGRGGVWKSTDEGGSWSQVGGIDNMEVMVLLCDPDAPETLYLGSNGDGFFVSTDGGVNWSSRDASDGIPASQISDILKVPGTSTLYVAENDLTASDDRTNDGLFKSVDGGQNFSRLSTGLNTNVHCLAFDTADSTGQTVYAGTFKYYVSGSNRVLKTRDGGASWSSMSMDQGGPSPWFHYVDNIWALAVGADGSAYAANWRGAYKLNRTTEVWELKRRGIGNVDLRAFAVKPDDADTLYFGSLDSTPWRSSDGGDTWTALESGFEVVDGSRRANTNGFAVHPASPNTIYAAGAGPALSFHSGLLKSTDAGDSWSTIANGMPATYNPDPTWMAIDIVVDPADANTLYTCIEGEGGVSHGVFKTSNGGSSWNRVRTISAAPTDLAISSVGGGTLAVSYGRKVDVSTDDGISWVSLDASPIGRILGIALHPTNPDVMIVAGNILGLYRTSDGGGSWNRVLDKNDLQAMASVQGLAIGSEHVGDLAYVRVEAVVFDPINPNRVFATHDPGRYMGVGLLVSEDGGQTWDLFDDDGLDYLATALVHLETDGTTITRLATGSRELYFYGENSGGAETVPTAPANPSASVESASRIRWRWEDNSTNETGFKIYVDVGSSDPTTLQKTTAIDATNWAHSGLAANTRYAMQVAATNAVGDSLRTATITAWTFAAMPVAPLVGNPTLSTLEVSIGSGDGNPSGTEYAIYVTPSVGGNNWVQSNGLVDSSTDWQTASIWDTVTVSGLTCGTEYTFSVKARNGAEVETATGLPSEATTDSRPSAPAAIDPNWKHYQ